MFKYLALVAISTVEGLSLGAVKQSSVESTQEKYLIPGGWKPDNLVHHPNGHVCAASRIALRSVALQFRRQ